MQGRKVAFRTRVGLLANFFMNSTFNPRQNLRSVRQVRPVLQRKLAGQHNLQFSASESADVYLWLNC